MLRLPLVTKPADSRGARRFALAAVCLSPLCFPALVHAQNTWIGTGANNLWSTPGNWLANNVPPVGGSASQAITFSGSGNLINVNDLGTGNTTTGTFALNSLTFDATAGAYSLSGATFVFSGTGPTLQINTANPITIANNISLAATLTLGTFAAGNPIAAPSFGTLTLSGALSGDATTDFVTRLNSLTLTGGTTGTIGGLLVGGVTGTPSSTAFALVTNGTYTVDRVSVGARNSAGNLTVSGTTSRIQATNDVNVASTGTGTLTIQNGAQVSGKNIFMGQTAGLTGTALVTGNGSLLSAVGASPNASLNVAYATGTQSTLTLQNGGAATATSVNIGGVASGSAGSSGTLAVSGVGRDSSGTALAATLRTGTIVVGYNNTGALNISNGGTVAATGDVFVGLNAGSAGSITIDSATTAGSALRVGGALSLGGQANPASPTTPLNGGTASVTLTNGANLTVTGDATLYNQGSISANNSTLVLGGLFSATGTNGGIALTNAAMTVGAANTDRQFNGVISGTGTNVVTKVGTGTAIWSGASTYSGTTNINRGTLEIDGSLNTGGTVNVNMNGTLAGTGAVGNIAEASGAFIAPGEGSGSIGTLQATSLVLNSNANFVFDLNLSTAASDRIVLSGTLSKLSSSASNFTFAFATTGVLPGSGTDTFTLATFTQPTDTSTRVSVSDLRYSGLGTNQVGVFGMDGQGYWNGLFTITGSNTPEPGSAALLVVGGMAALLPLRLWRRRSGASASNLKELPRECLT